ncbi:OmpA family protein [Bergeyella zoohelcum]|uniref:OmpA family protein n=1 Tax=Bergeyella zoohelcum TaxID=1015 RepID=UPI002A91AC76|nr:OmpA family protein [Bergeyella zoohelcum]MDY6025226.1 OmpA family protein [Bergeyella zoohelcum]
MKIQNKIFALALILPAVIFGQEVENTLNTDTEVYPNTFTSGSSHVAPFNKDVRRFNDWSISAGVGTAIIQSADLNSIKASHGGNKLGWTAYVSVNKAINHTFGLKLQYELGETIQGAYNPKKYDVAMSYKSPGARTEFQMVSLLGDVNFSNLLRRVDNKSNYRWAIHGYAGFGLLAFKAFQSNKSPEKLMTEVKPFTTASMIFQAGSGLKYKINKRFDTELRVMYVYTGSDSFDGGGEPYSTINQMQEPVSDNMITGTLGLNYKIGKHDSHLFWHDPMQELYYKTDVLATKNQEIEVCKSGDNDNDGVCDDWDRQLDTPAGARVDGAGVALDTDLDGVIDLYDKCVAVFGPASNNGCPVAEVAKPVIKNYTVVVNEVNKNFEGIEFALGKDVIRPKSFPKLNKAAEIIKTLDSNDQFLVIGATDTRGNAELNLDLSQRRADAVVKYLVSKGVPAHMLISEGRGKNDLKYPECDPASKCPEWKNEANRRVYFQAK